MSDDDPSATLDRAVRRYIIGDGQVQVRKPDGGLLAVLGRGTFFGEMALLSDDAERRARVTAVSICDIYSLNKADLEPIFAVQPSLREDMLAVANNRKKISADKKPGDRDTDDDSEHNNSQTTDCNIVRRCSCNPYDGRKTKDSSKPTSASNGVAKSNRSLRTSTGPFHFRWRKSSLAHPGVSRFSSFLSSCGNRSVVAGPPKVAPRCSRPTVPHGWCHPMAQPVAEGGAQSPSTRASRASRAAGGRNSVTFKEDAVVEFNSSDLDIVSTIAPPTGNEGSEADGADSVSTVACNSSGVTHDAVSARISRIGQTSMYRKSCSSIGESDKDGDDDDGTEDDAKDGEGTGDLDSGQEKDSKDEPGISTVRQASDRAALEGALDALSQAKRAVEAALASPPRSQPGPSRSRSNVAVVDV